jgi:hypothetical protein
MNRAAHVFLGLAIAIVFPAFVFYAAVTFIPDAKTAVQAPKYPAATSPNQPYCSTGSASSASPNYAPQLRAQQECAQQQATYQQELRDYNQEQSTYEQREKTYEQQVQANAATNENRSFYRAILAASLALLGLAALAAMASVPTLIYGMASGAGLTLLLGTGYILGTAPDDKQALAAGILIIVFAVCVGLMLWYERTRQLAVPAASHTPTPPITPVTPPSDAAPQTDSQSEHKE